MVLRRGIVTGLRPDKTCTDGIEKKRLRAGGKETIREQILGLSEGLGNAIALGTVPRESYSLVLGEVGGDNGVCRGRGFRPGAS